MSFSSMIKVSAWFIILAGMLAFEAPRGDLGWIAAFLAASGAAWFLRSRSVVFPPRTRNERTAAFILLIGGALAVMVFEKDLEASVFRIVFLMQVLRFFSAERAGHYVHAAALSLLPVLAACIAPKNFLFFPTISYFAASWVFFLAMLRIRAHLVAEAFKTKAKTGAKSDVAALMDAEFHRRTSFNRVFFFSLASLAYVFTAGAFLFIVLPRPSTGTGVRGAPEREYGRNISLPEKPSPRREGGFGRDSDAPGVFRDRIVLEKPMDQGIEEGPGSEVGTVRFYRGGRIARPPHPSERYFKGAVLDYFDGVTWTRYDERAWKLEDLSDGVGDGLVRFGPGSGLAAEWTRQEYRIRRSAGPLRFYMERLEAVDASSVIIDAAGTLQAVSPAQGDGEFTAYGVHSSLSGTARWLYEGDPPDKYTDLPPGLDRVESLAQAVAGAETGARKRAEAILGHLQGRCSYRRAPAPAGDADPLRAFLFETREGNCELFSTALAVMLRCLDVPARVVVGFHGGETRKSLNGAEYIVLSLRNAHAWVEVYVDDEGWVRFDATPASADPVVAAIPDDPPFAEEPPPVAPPAGPNRPGLIELVAKYDRRSQAAVVDKGRDGAKVLLRGVGRLCAGAISMPEVTAAIALLSLALMLALRFRGRIGRAAAAIGIRGAGSGKRATKFYEAFLRAMEARGFTRRPSQTPLEFAEAVVSRDSSISREVNLVTHSFNRAIYGMDSLSGEEMSMTEEAIGRLGENEAERSGGKQRSR